MSERSLQQTRTRVRVFRERARKLVAENLDINDEDDSKWPHNLRVSRAKVPHLEFATTTQTKARRKNGRSQFEYDVMENVYVGHPASRSSSW